MTPTELTKQAFKLYDNIRLHRFSSSEPSEQGKRLHAVGLRAFYRYRRRLEAEQNLQRIIDAARWGF